MHESTKNKNESFLKKPKLYKILHLQVTVIKKTVHEASFPTNKYFSVTLRLQHRY